MKYSWLAEAFPVLLYKSQMNELTETLWPCPNSSVTLESITPERELRLLHYQVCESMKRTKNECLRKYSHHQALGNTGLHLLGLPCRKVLKHSTRSH